jgi:hypothetical protein
LHHSERGWTSATSFHDLVDLDAGMLALVGGHVPGFRFLLDDISDEPEAALHARAATALARLALFCLRHARQPGELLQALARWVDLVREVRAAPNGREALERIWRYIFVVSNPQDPKDLVDRLIAVVGKESEEDVMTVADWLREEGRKEGRNEGRDATLRATLSRMLRARFGEVPEAAAARIQAAGPEQLDAWLDRILTAATLDDVLAQT